MPEAKKRRILRSDYDTDPERRRAIVRASRYITTEDVHPIVARRFAAEGLSPVLDVGAGEGALGRELDGVGLAHVLLDNSPNMLKLLPEGAVQGEATALPFPDDSFGAVAALYMLYHLADPLDAIAECHRVLADGGLFAAAASSADDAPELAAIFQATGPRAPATFDSDIGPGLIETIFGNVEVDRWDGPYVYLPDANALRDYCRGHGLSQEEVGRAPDLVSLPLQVTKRGAIMYARKA